MCPTYAFIDRANAKFNGAMSFSKDYPAIISAAWELDLMINRYLNDPDADSMEFLQKFGIMEDHEDDIAARDRKINNMRALSKRKVPEQLKSILSYYNPEV